MEEKMLTSSDGLKFSMALKPGPKPCLDMGLLVAVDVDADADVDVDVDAVFLSSCFDLAFCCATAYFCFNKTSSCSMEKISRRNPHFRSINSVRVTT